MDTIDKKNYLRKLRRAALLFLLAVPFPGQGQISLTGQVYTQNFNSFAGNNASVPSGWSATGSYAERGTGNGSSNSGGMWGYGTTGEYSLGFLGSSTSSAITYSVSFTNNTGATITTLILSYNFEQWRVGGGNTVGFTVTGTGGLSSVSLSALSQNSVNSGTTGTVQTTFKTIKLTGLNITNGANFGLSFASSDGSGNDNGKSIDDFSLCIPPSITSQSTAPQMVCAGVPFSPLKITSPGTGLTYQWYSNGTASNSGGINLGINAKDSTFTPPSSAPDTLYFYADVSNGTCATTSAVSGAMIVRAPVQISAQSTAAQAVCQGTSFSPVSVNVPGTGMSYQWFINTTESNTGGTSLGSAGQDSVYTPSSASDTVYYYYVEVTDGYCSDTSAVSGAMTLNYPPSITSQPSSTSYDGCVGSLFTSLKVSAKGTGLSYQWYSDTLPSGTGGISLGAAGQDSVYTPSSADTGKKYYYAVVSGTCPSPVKSSVSGAYIINPAPTITIHPSTDSQSVNVNGVLNALSISATGPGLTYQWYSNTVPADTGGTLISGANSSTYTPSNSQIGVLYYYVIVKGLCDPEVKSHVSGSVRIKGNISLTVYNTGLLQYGNRMLIKNSLTKPVSRFLVKVSNGTAVLSSLSFTTPGDGSSTYTKNDITNFRLFVTNDTIFSASTPVTGAMMQVSAKSSTTAEIITFNGLSHALAEGTYTIWITADILPNAAGERSIKIEAPIVTASIGAVNGTVTPTGVQTIQKGLGTGSLYESDPQVIVSSQGREVMVKIMTEEAHHVQILDLTGRMIADDMVQGGEKPAGFYIDGSAGYYLVRVSRAGTNHVFKVYLQ